jgi:hypothetical protein
MLFKLPWEAPQSHGLSGLTNRKRQMNSKLFRLSGFLVMFLVPYRLFLSIKNKKNNLRKALIPILGVLALTISIGCKQVSSQAEEKHAAKASGSASSASVEKQENMSMMFKGTVVEVIDAGRYTYIQVDTGEKRVWVAAPAFDGKTGDKVIVPPGVPMADFQSKKLNRRFDMIFFVGGIRRADEKAADMPMETLPADKHAIAMPTGNQMAHPSMDELAGGLVVDVGKVEKAKGGKTVSEIVTDRKNLAGREVWVRAKVVKFTPNIMGKNWLHVRDGSGDEKTNDLVVSTSAVMKVGDEALFRGIVSVDRDFGFGVNAIVVIEDAEVTAE